MPYIDSVKHSKYTVNVFKNYSLNSHCLIFNTIDVKTPDKFDFPSMTHPSHGALYQQAKQEYGLWLHKDMFLPDMNI